MQAFRNFWLPLAVGETRLSWAIPIMSAQEKYLRLFMVAIEMQPYWLVPRWSSIILISTMKGLTFFFFSTHIGDGSTYPGLPTRTVCSLYYDADKSRKIFIVTPFIITLHTFYMEQRKKLEWIKHETMLKQLRLQLHLKKGDCNDVGLSYLAGSTSF